MQLIESLETLVKKFVELKGIGEHSLRVLDGDKFKFIRYIEKLKTESEQVVDYRRSDSIDNKTIFRMFCTAKTFDDLDATAQRMTKDTVDSDEQPIPFNDTMKVVYLQKSGFLAKLKASYDLWAADVDGDSTIVLQGHKEKLKDAANTTYAEAEKVHHTQITRSSRFVQVVKEQQPMKDYFATPCLVLHCEPSPCGGKTVINVISRLKTYHI